MRQSTLFGIFTTSSKNLHHQGEQVLSGDTDFKQNGISKSTKNGNDAVSATSPSCAEEMARSAKSRAGKNKKTDPDGCKTSTVQMLSESRPSKKPKKGSLSLSKGKTKESSKPLSDSVTEYSAEALMETNSAPCCKSVAYEDFLKEELVASSNKKNTHTLDKLENDTTDSAEGNYATSSAENGEDGQRNPEKEPVNSGNDCSEMQKETLSYTEFLSMFKQPGPATDEFVTEEEKNEAESATATVAETSKSVGCKSITSYFSKCERQTKNGKASVSTLLTVKAEIHSQSPSGRKSIKNKVDTSKESLQKPEKISKVKSPKEDSNDIIVLSSETIFDVECKTKQGKSGAKKRKNEEAPSTLESSKKLKSSNVLEMKQMKEVDLGQEKHSNSVAEETKKEVVLSETESPLVSTPVSFSKTSQTTLCFGKSVVPATKEINKAETNDQPLESNKEDFTAGVGEIKNGLVEVQSGTRTVRHPTSRTVELSSKLRSSDNKVLDLESASPQSQKTPSDVKQTSNSVVKSVDTETNGLRRSSRIAQAVKESDLLEIESDEEEDGKRRESARKGGKKAKASKTTPVSEKRETENVRKSEGKLAPIFNMGKTKEEPKAPPPPQIDPEKERLRKEFLMSGIPEELKKQIATTANAIACTDYPPFPSVSHVHQLSVDQGTSTDVVIPRLIRSTDDPDLDTVSCDDLMWFKLGWKNVERYLKPIGTLFEGFTSHPRLQDPQVGWLLQEFQNIDSAFPFRRMYTHLLGKTSEVAAPGSHVAMLETPKPIPLPQCERNEVVIVDDTSPVAERLEIQQSSDPTACLWSDLHQPDNSEQMIGNKKVIKELKQWLEEWKTVMQMEVKKADRAKNAGSKAKNRGGWSDDSDFTDSEEEESRLCNTMLITGPHGIGKTSAVYALAQEMGYKVFEVNSSSLRSSKQLFAQLEEATQSHRVAQKKTNCAFMDSPTPGTNDSPKVDSLTSKATSKPPGSSAAQAFANLFKKNAASTGKGTENKTKSQSKKTDTAKAPSISNGTNSKKKSSKVVSDDLVQAPMKESPFINKKLEGLNSAANRRSERKRKYDETDLEVVEEQPAKQRGSSKVKGKKGKTEITAPSETESNLASGSLNLTSVSLILFDEVDVVFEEDKGFLSAVQHFMTSTKIPIILTSTDSKFHQLLSARHDRLVFKRPPLVSAASFLCTVCLAHGLRVSHRSIQNALQYLKGDIRRCLLHLQYWCESGGGQVQVPKAVNLRPLPGVKKQDAITGHVKNQPERIKSNNESASTKEVSSDEGSESEFICIGPRSRRSRRMVFDDDNDEPCTNSTVSTVSDSQVISASVQADKTDLQPTQTAITDVDENTKNSLKQEAEQMQEYTLSVPMQHRAFEANLIGLQFCDISAKSLMNYIRSPTVDLDTAVQALHSASTALSFDAVYHIALHCLPLLRKDVSTVQLAIPAQKEVEWPECMPLKKARRRIIQGDWLDSDGSDEDVSSKGPVVETAVDVTSHGTSSSQKESHSSSVPENSKDEGESLVSSDKNCQIVMDTSPEPGSDTKAIKPERNDDISVLSELSRFYDSISFVDSVENGLSATVSSNSSIGIVPGMDDGEVKIHGQSVAHAQEEWSSQMTYTAKVLSARHVHVKMKEFVEKHQGGKSTEEKLLSGTLQESIDIENSDQQLTEGTSGQGLPHELCLPIGKDVPDLWEVTEHLTNQSVVGPNLKHVGSCLGLMVRSSDPSLHTDYLPFLRQICRSENERHLAKTQRRFHHYLDNIGLGLKASSIASLTSTYVVSDVQTGPEQTGQ